MWWIANVTNSGCYDYEYDNRCMTQNETGCYNNCYRCTTQSCSRFSLWSTQYTTTCAVTVTALKPRITGRQWCKSDRRWGQWRPGCANVSFLYSDHLQQAEDSVAVQGLGWVGYLLGHFTFLCPSHFSKYLKSIRPHINHCKICFSGGRMAFFWGSISNFLFSGLCSALVEIYQFLCFEALKYTTMMGLADITDLEKIQMPKPVALNFWNCTFCQSLLSEVLLGLLFSA